MKKKIMLTAALLVWTGSLANALPNEIKFAGETYKFTKTKNNIHYFYSADEYKAILLSPFEIPDPEKNAHDAWKAESSSETNIRIEHCAPQDVIVQRRLFYGSSMHDTYTLDLRRFTKHGMMGLGMLKGPFPKDSEILKAFCRLSPDLLK